MISWFCNNSDNLSVKTGIQQKIMKPYSRSQGYLDKVKVYIFLSQTIPLHHDGHGLLMAQGYVSLFNMSSCFSREHPLASFTCSSVYHTMMNKIFLTSRIWPDSDLRSFGCQGQWEKRILKNCQGYIFGTERQMIPVTGVETNFLCH